MNVDQASSQDLRRERLRCGFLFFILSTAAFLRLLYINQPFIDLASWRESDDATIADNFFRGHLNIFLPEISWNGPGPNYVGYEFQLTTYLASVLYHLLGSHDWIARGIAVGFGVWGVFVFYKLVCRAFDEKQALVSCAVYAVTPIGIFVDRSFLPDPIMVSLVLTSFWMLVAYLQDGRPKYLTIAVAAAIFGLLTKISGAIVGLPALYAIVHQMPTRAGAQLKYFCQMFAASILVLVPVVTYYAWAIHVSKTYPPYHVAAKENWIWDSSFKLWFESNYFLPKFAYLAVHWLWGIPLLGLASIGLLSAPINYGKASLPWLFHFWLLAVAIFYAFGARELVINIWNLNIADPALAGLAAQGLLVLWIATSRFGKVVLLLLVIAVHGLALKNLRVLYHPYARESRELGLALARASQPTDLVVTIARDIGDPTAIHYSHRRGWVFPPPWPGVSWGDIVDEFLSHSAIRRVAVGRRTMVWNCDDAKS